MAITEDTGNQPAAVTTTGVWTGTALTTAAFSAQAGTLIVAILAGFGNSTAAVTGAITDSLSGSWTLLKRQNGFTSGVTQGTAEVWARYVATAPGSMTVKAVASANGGPGGQLVVRCLLGANPTQPGALGGHDTGGGAGQSAAQCSVAAGTGNVIYGAAMNSDSATLLTVLGNTTSVAAFSDSTNGITEHAFKSTSTTAGTATYGYSTSVHHDMCAVELLAAAASIPDVVMAPMRGR